MSSVERRSVRNGPPMRTFLDGSEYRVADLQTARVGLGVFKPGWVWSKHAGAQTGNASQRHVGYIQSGCMAVEGADGVVAELGPGEAFEAGPGHDAWVVGDEECVAIDFSVAPAD